MCSGHKWEMKDDLDLYILLRSGGAEAVCMACFAVFLSCRPFEEHINLLLLLYVAQWPYFKSRGEFLEDTVCSFIATLFRFLSHYKKQNMFRLVFSTPRNYRRKYGDLNPVIPTAMKNCLDTQLSSLHLRGPCFGSTLRLWQNPWSLIFTDPTEKLFVKRVASSFLMLLWWCGVDCCLSPWGSRVPSVE